MCSTFFRRKQSMASPRRGENSSSFASVGSVLGSTTRRNTSGTLMAPRRKQAEIPVHQGSGNVYADLGFADSAEELVKASLAMMIDEVIRERGLTQHDAAALMGI